MNPVPGTAASAPPDPLTVAHLEALDTALGAFRREGDRLARWGAWLAERLAGRRGRLLIAGNGGSAAQAQHLAAELVGRLRDERSALSAIALHTDTCSLTAIANDYGYEWVFARQVEAHGRPDDVLLLLSTSGASTNLVAAAEVAHRRGLVVWGLTGPLPNPLAARCDEVVTVASPEGQTVQELHLVALHLLCEHVERVLRTVVPDPDRVGDLL